MARFGGRLAANRESYTRDKRPAVVVASVDQKLKIIDAEFEVVSPPPRPWRPKAKTWVMLVIYLVLAVWATLSYRSHPPRSMPPADSTAPSQP